MWRWLPVRRRLRLATLRWLWLWGLWLLLLMGTVPRLLKGTLRPEDNKSPSQHCATGRGRCASGAHRTGAISIRPHSLAGVNSKHGTTKFTIAMAYATALTRGGGIRCT